MNPLRLVFATAVRPFSTKKKRANRKNMPKIESYDTLFLLIPVAYKD